jgi:hypothetical protein
MNCSSPRKCEHVAGACASVPGNLLSACWPEEGARWVEIHERTREYLNFDFGWWDSQDDTFRRVRYMPSRWADEFIVALRRAQAHIAQHETALFVDLAAKLDGRLGPP